MRGALEHSVSRLHLMFSHKFQGVLTKNKSNVSNLVDSRLSMLLQDATLPVEQEANLRLAITVEECFNHGSSLEELKESVVSASQLLIRACRSSPASLTLLEMEINVSGSRVDDLGC